MAVKDEQEMLNKSKNKKYGNISENEESEKSEKPQDKLMVGISTVFRFADRWDIALIIGGTVMAIITGGMFPISFIVFGKLTDIFILNSRMSHLNISDHNLTSVRNDTLQDEMYGYSIAYSILGFSTVVAAFFQVFLWTLASGRQIKRIRSLFFHHVMQQEISWFDINETGDLSTRLSDDIYQIQEGIGDKLGLLIQAYATFIISFIISFSKGWKLTLVMLAISPLLALTAMIYNQMLLSFNSKGQKAYAKAGAVAEEVLATVSTVFAFNGQNKAIKRYHKNLELVKEMGSKKAVLTGFTGGFTMLLIHLFYALAFWYGTTLVLSDDYSLGKVLTVFYNVMYGSYVLGQMSLNIQYFASARVAAHKIYSIIDQIPNIDSFSEEGFKPDYIKGDIEFKNIHFSYPSRPEVKILNSMSLSVKSGQTIALVGSSGCGKSTTIQLLQRFYDPEEGAIFVDGHDIRSLNIRYLREMIGVVSQEPILFATTIAENIRYGRLDVTQEEIERATKESNAYDFIMNLPDKFETLVGDRGTQLSGGQKQRIAIARALVRNPKILLLDEATSALDAESETIVQAALDKVRVGRTTIVVAHRLSTIQNADIIGSFRNGEIVELGTHRELMELEGVYHSLVTMQTFQEVKDKEGADTGGYGDRSNLSMSQCAGGSSLAEAEAAEQERDKLKQEEEEHVPAVSFFEVMRLNLSEWPYLLLGTIGAVVNGVLQPSFSVIFSKIIGVFANPDQALLKQNSLFLCLMFVALGVVAFVAIFVQGVCFGKCGEILTLKLRLKTFTSMMRQDLSWFDDSKNSAGALATRLASDPTQVQGAAGTHLATMVQIITNLGTSITIAFIYSWELTLLILLWVPILLIFSGAELKMLTRHAAEDKRELEAAGRIASETINNIRTVASLGTEPQFESLYEENLRVPYKNSQKKALIHGFTYGLTSSMVFFAFATSFIFGVWLIRHGRVTVEEVFLVTTAVLFGALAAGQASILTPNYAKAKTAASHLMMLIKRNSAIDNLSEEGISLETFNGDITLENVRFNYPSRPNAPVLQGLNLKVQKGETLALVGSSGCGKSTTIQLLERFYDPQEGRVALDGVSVKELNIHWLRSQIGIVSQEPVLFDCSLAENIAYGDNSRSVSMDEIVAAAKAANIHSFIDGLPQKYDTQAGDKGTQLSGGQKQRIAIARAIIRNPKLLLLDEATSALDTESEKVVQEALDQARKGRTCIVVAHRLSTIQNADSIAVFQGGVVVEKGTHQQLIARKGVYHMLVTKQMGHNSK